MKLIDSSIKSNTNTHIPPPNFTTIPNIILDVWITELSPAEFKIILVIARKTFGWHKRQDRISLSQFETTTGLSRRGIIDAINSLAERGYLKKTLVQDDAGDCGASMYYLQVAEPSNKYFNGEEEHTLEMQQHKNLQGMGQGQKQGQEKHNDKGLQEQDKGLQEQDKGQKQGQDRGLQQGMQDKGNNKTQKIGGGGEVSTLGGSEVTSLGGSELSSLTKESSTKKTTTTKSCRFLDGLGLSDEDKRTLTNSYPEKELKRATGVLRASTSIRCPAAFLHKACQGGWEAPKTAESVVESNKKLTRDKLQQADGKITNGWRFDVLSSGVEFSCNAQCPAVFIGYDKQDFEERVRKQIEKIRLGTP